MALQSDQCEISTPTRYQASGDIAEGELLASSRVIDEKFYQTDFIVPGMHCISCIRTLEKNIARLGFVQRVRANLSLKKVSVVWRKGDGNIVAIERAIGEAGFEHSLFDIASNSEQHIENSSKKLLVALAVAGFAAVNIMLLSISVWAGADGETAKLFHLISGVIAVPAVIFSGRPFYHSALGALKAKRLNMDVPISLAVLMALGMSIYESMAGGRDAYFDAAVTLLFFLLIGRYLDNLMREKARNSVVQLSRLSAKGATLVGEGAAISYIGLNEIRPDMVIRIKPGERVAVDGVIIKGQSDLDRSLVTGESVPVAVKTGVQVEAGTMNLTGPIDIRVLRDASGSFLAEITGLMEAAENGRGRFTRVADKMAQIYAPAVHLLAAIAFIGWMIFTGGDWHVSVYVAISVLIITCPCALGLAVPVVHVIGARRLFKEGILIRDGSGFERLEEVDRIIFDKTGTLTNGMPRIKSSSITDDHEAAIARTLGASSSHPFSKAVTEYFNLPLNNSVEEIREVPGAGVEGRVDGRLARLGEARWVREIAAADQSDKGRTASGLEFSLAKGSIANFEIGEELRDGAIDAVTELEKVGMKLEILSGDGEKRVNTTARQLGIDEYKFSQTPSDKITRIKAIESTGSRLLMAGDGLNDSPALAAAHVSIAPADACDIARQTADFVFTRKSLLAVPFTLAIARRTGRLVRQNFALAIAYNSIAIPIAMAGYITPLIAAIAMSASSIVVVANSMRLNVGTGIGGMANKTFSEPASNTSKPDAQMAENQA